jgi:hypothetical protein
MAREPLDSRLGTHQFIDNPPFTFNVSPVM